MLGDILAELRKDSGMLQKELAQRLGVSAATISAYECNKTTPSDEIKVMIAEMFNVSLDYLLGATAEKIELSRENVLVLPQRYSAKVQESMLEYGTFLDDKRKRRKKD